MPMFSLKEFKEAFGKNYIPGKVVGAMSVMGEKMKEAMEKGLSSGSKRSTKSKADLYHDKKHRFQKVQKT